MKIEIHVDTNEYNELEEADGTALAADRGEDDWSLFGLKLATFQDWQTIGHTPLWTVDGDAWCGTRYACEVNFRDELLLRCLIDKIKKTCGERLISISINDLPVTFTDDDLMIMRLKWMESMKQKA